MLLFIGEKVSLFASYNNYKSIENSGQPPIILDGRAIFDEKMSGIMPSLFMYRIFKNHPEGKLTFTHYMPLDDFFTYEEPLNNFNWKIIDEKTRILGYTVQKATTNYGGRKWIAWFTPDLPINDGPYKFNGLPGLILRVEDSRQHYVFEINSIGRPKDKTPILKNDRKYIITERKKFNELYKYYTQNKYEYIKSVGIFPDDPTPFIEASKWENNFLELKNN